jgi:hypothetical protein
MKKAILLICFMMVAIAGFGQTYEMIVDTAKRWSCLSETSSGSPPPQQKSTSNIRFANDTTINLKTYKVVESSTDSLHLSWFAFGIIREDTSGKVYYRAYADTSEKTLYDFNLEVGDSIPLPSFYMHVDTVDSVYIYDKFLKRIVFAENETWIEGLGSLCGVLMSGYGIIVGAQHFLLCYYEDDTLKYKNPDYTECYYNNVGINEWKNLQKISIFPNPSNGEFEVKSMNAEVKLVEIYNVLGEKVFSSTVSSHTSTGLSMTVDLPGQPEGIYFMKVKTDKGNYVGKAIKQ